MRTYRNSAAHLAAMPKLKHWCDEASYTHWEQELADVTWEEAHRRLASEPHLSSVRHPSAAHAAGHAVPAGRA